ncbi:unnamed protein product [Spirodela intermedia]|uniref:Uncharacterized protein n=1 Tax=Spirodela intermedia TaxID=51605 RepID=A0A7I8J8M3_SPIIN|nr:unnamed protein product [Spirodela intermedia]CAA6666381.1 unnamed protein product [Spirodela intermedia]
MNRRDDSHNRPITHYDQAATTILDHQVIKKGGCNHAHRNTFYLVQWQNNPRRLQRGKKKWTYGSLRT